MTQIYVKVEPDSRKFSIEEDVIPKIKLEESPENGRANRELLKRLQKILGAKPGIISGHKSRRKKLEIPLDEDEIRQKMREYDG